MPEAELTPDSYMAGQQAELTPDSYMAGITAGESPAPGNGFLAKAKGFASDVGRTVTTPIPQLVHNALGTGREAATMTGLYDTAMDGAAEKGKAIVDTMFGTGTAEKLPRDFPFAKWVASFANEAVRGGMGLLDFGTTPLGAALPAAGALPNVVKAGIGAGFGADMAPGTYEAVTAAAADPTSQTVPRAAVQAIMNLLPLAHVMQSREAGNRIAEQRQAGAEQAKSYSENVPFADVLTRMGNEELANLDAPNQLRQAQVNREIATRMKAGKWDVPHPQPERKPAHDFPETGIPEAEARLADQRENVARQLVGKPVAELTPDEFMVVDQTAREGYGSAQRAAEPAVGLAERPVARPETVPAPEAPAVSPKPAESQIRAPQGLVVYGKPTEVRVPGENRGYRAVYAVREAEDVVSSHNAFNFEKNPEYHHANDRNYAEPRNAERIVKQEAEFDPSFLITDNPDAVNGPVIIDPSGNVLGGNSRAMTLERVRSNRPESSQNYRDMLKQNAKKFGVSPDLLDRMKQPTLVRQIVDDIPDPPRVITDLNKTGTAALTQAERAIADSKRISRDTLEHLQSKIDELGEDGTLAKALEGSGGKDIVTRLESDGLINQSEKTALLNSDGTLTPDGKGRISRLMVGRLFEDARSLEETTPELRAKLERVVAPLARITGNNGWDITPQLKEAVGLVKESRRRGQTIEDLTRQGNLLGEGEYSEEAVQIARKLEEKPSSVAKAFRQYAAESDMARPDQPLLGIDPPTPAESFREAFKLALPEPVAAAKSRIKKSLTSERGSISGKPTEALLDDLVTVGAHYLRTAATTFKEWSARMVQDFGEAIRPHLLRIFAKARAAVNQMKLAGGPERGSFSRKAVAAPVEGTAAPPKKTAAAATEAGAVPAPEKLTTSPSYDKTKGKILEKVDVSPEVRNELSQRMTEWEATNPERKAVTFEDIRQEARALDPRLVLYLKQPKPGETLNPALRFAARESLNSLNEEIFRRRTDLSTRRDSMDPTKIMDEEARLGRLENDAQGMLDVLIPTRSQDGRNLAYHRMMAEKSFDVEYWISRAKRAAGGALDESTATNIREILAEGQQAQEAATQRVRSRQKRGTSAPPTTEQKVERGVERRVKNLEAKAAGEVKEPGPWALTPEERKLVDQDPRVLEARRKLARTMMTVEKTGLLDTIIALRRAGLLTGPKTHARNITGNTAFQVLEETARIPSAVLDAAMSVATGHRTVEGVNPRAVAKATYAASTRGIREAGQIMRKGANQEQLEHIDAFKEMNSGSKVVDAYVNTVFRSMAAEDKVFRVYAFERSIQEQMRLAKVKAPTEAMRTQAIADAEFATFNNKSPIANAWQTAKEAAKRSGPAGKAVAFGMDMVVPFARTPANILARVIDYTPVGAGIRIGAHVWKAVADKSFTPEQQRGIAQAFGRGLTGSALIYMGWKLGAAGLLTGTSPDEPGQRATAEAAGRLPGAIRVGDSWQMIGGLSPVGNLLVIGATLQRESTKPLKDEAKRPAAILKTATRTVMDQPMLTGTSQVMEALNQPGGMLERAAGQMAGSFVPTAAADVASLGDTVRRDTAGEGTLDSMAKSIAARLPGARNQLPERRDVLGRVQPQNKMAAVNPGIGSPARELMGTVERELIREKVGITRPAAKLGETPAELRLRREITGRLVHAALQDVVDSAEYQELPQLASGDESRRLMLEKAISRARAEINKAVNDEDYKGMSASERTAFLRELLSEAPGR